MPVQVKIDPNTGLTKCGNSIEREKCCQMLFSTTMTSGNQGWGLGIPNVLRNAEQIISYSMNNKKGDFVEACYDPHAYWSVDHRPVGTKQIVDSGIFSYLFGYYSKNSTLKDIEKYTDFYIEFVNNHFKQHCLTNNTPWFVEIDIHGKYSLEDYHRIQNKLLNSCPDRDFIGVWHCRHGLKQLEELCERFDYIAMGSSFSAEAVQSKVQGIRWLAEHHPEKCVHWLGTDNIVNLLAPSCVHNLTDTCDSTGWKSSTRYGLRGKKPDGTAYRRDWVAPAIDWCSKHWFNWFPKQLPKNSKEWHDENGDTATTREAHIWLVCKVYCIWSYFNLYGYQKQWEKAGFRRVTQKILDGKGAELCDDDIDEFLYEMPHKIFIGENYPERPFYVADGYQEKFKNVKCILFNV